MHFWHCIVWGWSSKVHVYPELHDRPQVHLNDPNHLFSRGRLDTSVLQDLINVRLSLIIFDKGIFYQNIKSIAWWSCLEVIHFVFFFQDLRTDLVRAESELDRVGGRDYHSNWLEKLTRGLANQAGHFFLWNQRTLLSWRMIYSGHPSVHWFVSDTLATCRK